MKKISKIIIGVLMFFLAVVLILGLIAPKTMQVKESVIIKAPYEEITKYLLDFRKIQKWSPWAKLDTNMQNTYEGEPMTLHHKHLWSGNEKVGKGSQEIVYISKDSIATRLVFEEPFQDEANAFFLIKQKGIKEFEVSWGFTSEIPYPMNGIMWLMNMEDNIKKDYKAGMEKLKQVVEENLPTANKEIKPYEMEESTFLVEEDTVSLAALHKFFEKAFSEVFQFAAEKNIKTQSAPVAIYYFFNDSVAHLAAGVKIEKTPMEDLSGNLKIIDLPKSKALYMNYYGSYENIDAAHFLFNKYMKDNRIRLNDIVLEEYITNPQKEPDTTKWLTKIYYRIL